MRRFLLFAALVVLFIGGSAAAQEVDFREDFRFAEMLRARGDNDLALEFLKRLERTASPELLKELPLEFAKTGLRVAGEEAEVARRLALYKEARENFQKFIDANPQHPRVAEANIDIAHVLNLQGKTELGQALMAEDAKTKKDLAAQGARRSRWRRQSSWRRKACKRRPRPTCRIRITFLTPRRKRKPRRCCFVPRMN